MITAKQAYEIAKEWMGPFALVSAGYETESHFIFLREHNRGKLWTDHASFIPATKEYDLMQQGTQLNLAEMCE